MIDDMNSKLDLFSPDDNKVQQINGEKRITHSEEDGIDNVNDITLEGCSPVPLASYLKALGVFRLVAEQKDRKVRGYWKNDRFHLVTRLTEDELVDFFVKEYKPTSVVSPWNGGSGFFPKDYKEGIQFIVETEDKKFDIYKKAVEISKKTHNKMNIAEKLESEQKEELLTRCRNDLPDDSLNWIDSAFVLTGEIIAYPPLLGTGGNDGRLDFSKNFMQNIIEINNSDMDDRKRYLNNSLFGEKIIELKKGGAIGQFYPSATGGANASSGFDSVTVINNWDYVLNLEGSLILTASTSRKFSSGQAGGLSYPFSVRSIGSGYGSSSEMDGNNSRPEIWLPIWTNGSSYNEIKRVFSEGRSTIGRRYASNGMDFARSIASLGVDRGISEFQRYGFMVRNGLAYFATPLGRFKVKRQPQVDLIRYIDPWLDRIRPKLSSKEIPNSIKSALHKLDGFIIELCKQKSTQKIQSILIELGKVEVQLNKSKRWVKDIAHIDSIPYLSKKWIDECNDGSVEYRLALSLASIYGRFGKDHISIRQNLEPIILPEEKKPFFKFENNENEKDIVDTNGDLIHVMNRILARRIIKAQKAGCDSYSDRAMFYCSPSDISDFLEERVNDSKIWDLFNGLVLINWKKREEIHVQKPDLRDTIYPDSVYMMMKLCYCDYEFPSGRIPLVPDIHRRCSAGDGTGAFRSSLKRLRGSGVIPAVTNVSVSRRKAIRMAASLLFPVHENQIREYLNRIGRTGTYNFKE